MKPRLPRQQNPAACADNPLPGDTTGGSAPQSPGNLAGRSGMARSARHIAVSGDLAPGNAKDSR